MGCPAYKLLLSRYIDDALSERERQQLISHLMGCPSCATMLARYRQIQSLLQHVLTPQPSADLRQRVLASIERRNSFRSLWSLHFGRLLLSFVTLGVVVVLAGVLWLGWRWPQRAIGSATPQFGYTISPLKGDSVSTATLKTNSPGEKLSGEGGRLARALERAKAQTTFEVHLPEYLPPGARLERLNLESVGPTDRINEVDISYVTKDGRKIRLWQSSRSDLGGMRLGHLAQKRLLIGGREWWYERRSDGQNVVHILRTRRDGVIISVDTAAPLDELIKIVESLK
ncbi:MAG: zf-HC2 domain-containing protein [Chloroflexi bacterium]|nr:zf-HC2 domain-containing protein [Chloroflexota bacterium]MCL5074687.1 zf-HC2 domain-containing protein [Chloroflexota bacterium]